MASMKKAPAPKRQGSYLFVIFDGQIHGTLRNIPPLDAVLEVLLCRAHFILGQVPANLLGSDFVDVFFDDPKDGFHYAKLGRK
jgi:hypothetical protein